ncbi:hypothetical protein LCGC14_0548750 [marine sediment metagenome]|uniref:Uncharacterized protein n=1 Tax=marine sediment metagenome TaxID=412755 RepID=A0A0F9RQQ1_9ZZZZ
MKCVLCKEISDRLNELEELHGEEFCTQFKKTLSHPCEPENTNTMEELLDYKRAYFEAGWLDAIEEMQKLSARFKITEQTLNTLESEDVFLGLRYFTSEMQNNNILQQLQSLLNKEVLGEANFIDMLKKTIGDKHTAMFKKIILKHSQILKETIDATQ